MSFEANDHTGVDILEAEFLPVCERNWIGGLCVCVRLCVSFWRFYEYL